MTTIKEKAQIPVSKSDNRGYVIRVTLFLCLENVKKPTYLLKVIKCRDKVIHTLGLTGGRLQTGVAFEEMSKQDRLCPHGGWVLGMESVYSVV